MRIRKALRVGKSYKSIKKMKNLKKSLIVLLTLYYCFANAQTNKVSVGVIPFTFATGTASPTDVYAIQEAVTNSLVKTKRFNIVDRNKMAALKSEKEIQKGEEFIKSKVYAKGNAIGAQFLISGHVVAASAMESFFKDSKTGQQMSSGFKARLIIVLQLIDVGTGQVSKSETIEPKGGSLFGTLTNTAPKTAQLAINKAILDIEDKIDNFVSENFPVTFKIVEVQSKETDGSLSEVLISGGTDFNLKKGQKLSVIEIVIMELDGKKLQRKKEIGEMKILKIEGENFSVCSVTKGGKEIASRLEANATIQIVTK